MASATEPGAGSGTEKLTATADRPTGSRYFNWEELENVTTASVAQVPTSPLAATSGSSITDSAGPQQHKRSFLRMPLAPSPPQALPPPPPPDEPAQPPPPQTARRGAAQGADTGGAVAPLPTPASTAPMSPVGLRSALHARGGIGPHSGADIHSHTNQNQNPQMPQFHSTRTHNSGLSEFVASSTIAEVSALRSHVQNLQMQVDATRGKVSAQDTRVHRAAAELQRLSALAETLYTQQETLSDWRVQQQVAQTELHRCLQDTQNHVMSLAAAASAANAQQPDPTLWALQDQRNKDELNMLRMEIENGWRAHVNTVVTTRDQEMARLGGRVDQVMERMHALQGALNIVDAASGAGNSTEYDEIVRGRLASLLFDRVMNQVVQTAQQEALGVVAQTVVEALKPLQVHCGALDETCSKLQEMVVRQDRAIESMQGDVRTLQRTVKDLSVTVARIDEDDRGGTERKESLSAHVQQLDDALAVLQGDVTKQREQVGTAQTTREWVEQQFAAMRTQIRSVEQGVDKRVENLGKEFITLRAKQATHDQRQQKAAMLQSQFQEQLQETLMETQQQIQTQQALLLQQQQQQQQQPQQRHAYRRPQSPPSPKSRVVNQAAASLSQGPTVQRPTSSPQGDSSPGSSDSSPPMLKSSTAAAAVRSSSVGSSSSVTRAPRLASRTAGGLSSAASLSSAGNLQRRPPPPSTSPTSAAAVDVTAVSRERTSASGWGRSLSSTNTGRSSPHSSGHASRLPPSRTTAAVPPFPSGSPQSPTSPHSSPAGPQPKTTAPPPASSPSPISSDDRASPATSSARTGTNQSEATKPPSEANSGTGWVPVAAALASKAEGRSGRPDIPPSGWQRHLHLQQQQQLQRSGSGVNADKDKCEFCLRLVEPGQLKEHWKKCELYMVKCPYRCGQRLLERNLEKHLLECSKRPVTPVDESPETGSGDTEDQNDDGEEEVEDAPGDEAHKEQDVRQLYNELSSSAGSSLPPSRTTAEPRRPGRVTETTADSASKERFAETNAPSGVAQQVPESAMPSTASVSIQEVSTTMRGVTRQAQPATHVTAPTSAPEAASAEPVSSSVSYTAGSLSSHIPTLDSTASSHFGGGGGGSTEIRRSRSPSRGHRGGGSDEDDVRESWSTRDFVMEWSKRDVAQWIRDQLRLPEAATRFLQKRIDGKMLLQLTPEDLSHPVRGLGVPPKQRAILLDVITTLQNNGNLEDCIRRARQDKDGHESSSAAPAELQVTTPTSGRGMRPSPGSLAPRSLRSVSTPGSGQSSSSLSRRSRLDSSGKRVALVQHHPENTPTSVSKGMKRPGAASVSSRKDTSDSDETESSSDEAPVPRRSEANTKLVESSRPEHSASDEDDDEDRLRGGLESNVQFY